MLATLLWTVLHFTTGVAWSGEPPANIPDIDSVQAAPSTSTAKSPSDNEPTLTLDGKEFRLTGPYRHENLAVYFVHARHDDKQEFITLDEGLRKKLVTVREKDGGGTVQQLLIENRSDRPLYLQDGDRLSGGRQDRTVPYPLVIAPNSGEQTLAAFCIEQSRWASGQRGDQFDAAGSVALAPRSVRTASKIKGSQSEVWASVADQKKAYAASLKAGHTNSSLNETLDSTAVREAADHYLQKLEKIVADKTDVVGVAFAVDGRIEEVNVYAGSGLLGKVYPRLLQSYAMEAALTLANIDPQMVAAQQQEQSVRSVLAGQITGRFDARDLHRCVADLSKKLGVEIEVDWTALINAGVRRDDRITLHYRDEPAEEVLLKVMKIAAQKSPDDMACDVTGGKVKLSRRSIIEQAQANRERLREYAQQRAKEGLDTKAAPPSLSDLATFMRAEETSTATPRDLDSLNRLTVTELKDRYYSCSEHNGVMINRQWMRVEPAKVAVAPSGVPASNGSGTNGRQSNPRRMRPRRVRPLTSHQHLRMPERCDDGLLAR